MSLLSELGFEYAHDMFSGAMLVKDGRSGYIDGVYEDGRVRFHPVMNRGVMGPPEYIDHEYFTSWSTLSYPKLGYRQDAETNFLGYVTRSPSVRRGFHFGEAQVDVQQACVTIDNSLGCISPAHPEIGSRHYASLAEFKIPLIMLPSYTPFHQGLVQILSGEIPYFCTSAEFAVCPSGSAAGFEILYRRRHIGSISPSGNIELLIDTPTIRELWLQEINRV